MIAPVDTDSLWLVLMRSDLGQESLRVWRAPPGRDGLRRIFRAREEDAIPVSATTMSVLTHSKMPMEPLSKWQRMTRGNWQVVLTSSGNDVPSLMIVQAPNSAAALRLAENEGHSPLGAVDIDQVKEALSRMQELLHEIPGTKPDKDLIKNPPQHNPNAGPSIEEQAAIALREKRDVWNRVATKS